ncbi:potassium channel family protein [Virgisporangium aliadipatigenens]|uniref:potassium channel family protein n=1 Tax=Virgisporangium aliadipatigenens TaxID=741659 RepID=UPI001944BDA2|nr:NAD-binding protein [Virgisporangium aliadipatigenens]
MARDSWLARRLRAGGPPHRIVRPRSAAEEAEDDAPVPIAGHLVVCGDEPLAHRLVEELVTRYRRHVTVILPSRRRNHGPQIARLPNVRIVEADRLDVEAFRRARVAGAESVAFVGQDDVGNIHAALQAQELNPRVHLVIRMFNLSLGLGIRNLFRDCSVISDAAMAAPAFVAAALGEVAPVHVRRPGRTLFVADPADVPPDRVICALSSHEGGRTVLLPRDPAGADLVLAMAEGRDGYVEHLATPDVPGRFRRWLRRQRANPFRAVRVLFARKLALVAVGLVAVLFVGTGILTSVNHLPWYDAAYVTLLTALGGAEPDTAASTVVKITQTVLTVVSIALIPVLTGAVVEAVVNARLAIALGRLREPMSGHVVVVGLGNVGTRVIRDLHTRGVPVVAIDRVGTARGAQLARSLDIPVVVGDASRAETLRAASVQSARALVVLSTDDVVNLEAAITGRELNPAVRVVLRLFDGDFADRVERAFSIDVSRSVSYLAAPSFAAAMLRREVIGAIPVDRRVLLIAEIPVCRESTVDGGTVATVHDLGGVRVIAVKNGLHQQWSPALSTVLSAGEELVVVATRDGLGRVVEATT